MKRKTIVIIFSALLAVAVSASLAACTTLVATPSAPTTQNTDDTLTEVPAKATPGVGQLGTANDAAQSDLTRTDEQGAVVITVQPANLSDPSETLDFDISMETHSVELDMDLATLATLTTDTGKTAQALKWDAPRGGHHVSGTLLFPAKVDGSSLLDGVKQLTLVIKDVDAPERTFVWELGS